MRTRINSLCTIFLSIFLISNIAYAQSFKSKKLIKDAHKAYSESNYAESIDLCKEALKHSPDYEEAKFLLGRCYYETADPSQAQEQFSEIISAEDFGLQSKFWLAMSYKMAAQYSQSIEYFDQFLKEQMGKNVQTVKAQVEKEGALLALSMQPSGADEFQFKNIGSRINTPESEFSVVFGEAPNKIIVSSQKIDAPENGENLKYLFAQGWMRVSENDEFDFLNTPKFESAGAMASSGEVFIFTQCQTRENNCRLMISVRKEGVWQKATPLPQNINFPQSNTFDPAFSVNGDTLFFVSDRRGGLGETDIWFTINENGSWSDPVNIGQPINTPYREASPFAGEEGTFYFSSDGHPGLGGLDIFYTEGLNGKRQIINAGLPFNSSYDDKHLVVNKQVGYLASNRTGGEGLFDIYTFVNNRKEEPAETIDERVHESVYSSLFASKFYDIETRFLGMDVETYESLSKSQKKQLSKEVADKLTSMSPEEKERIKNEDKILYASLSRDKKFFVDKLAAIYFESNNMTLAIPDEDLAWFSAMEITEQRKLYRLMASTVSKIQHEFISQNTPLITDETSGTSLEEEKKLKEEKLAYISHKPSVSLVKNYEGETYTQPSVETKQTGGKEPDNDLPSDPNAENKMIEEKLEKKDVSIVTEPAPAAVIKKKPEAKTASPRTEIENATKFSNFIANTSSLSFYQSLSFPDRKRVDRIMAIKLVNEKYVLNPTLSASDRNYYRNLPSSEKEIVDRLQLFFRSWSLEQESANLRNSDIDYLTSLPAEKQEVIKRIIVRQGIGVDNDNLIKFDASDWVRYKRFSEVEIEKIKAVAHLLKEHKQFFDVALAYASENYEFTNSMALRNSQGGNPVLLASSDPEMALEGIEHVFESIYFNPGEHKLRNEAIAAINELVSIYRQNPEIFVHLVAYSGELSSQAENTQLSQQRAEAAKNYMTSVGIPDYKIKTRGKSISAHSNEVTELASLESRKLEIGIANSSQVFESGNTTYLIQPGNTLYSLAKANGVSVEELMAMNGLTDNTILAYRPLRVKKDATLDPDQMVEPSAHLVYRETGVAEKTTESDSRQPDAETMDRGEDIMVIKVNEGPRDTRIFHTVAKGDRLKSIAKKYGVEKEEIMKLNNLKNKKVKPGNRLLIKESSPW